MAKTKPNSKRTEKKSVPVPVRDSQRVPASVKNGKKIAAAAAVPVPVPVPVAVPVPDQKMGMRESMRKLEIAHRLFQGRAQSGEISKSETKLIETWNFSISQCAVGLNSVDDDVNSYADQYNKKRLTFASAKALAVRLRENLQILADLFASAK